MERNELYEWAVIFGVYGWMIVSGVVFHDQRTLKAASDILSMAGMVAFLFVKEAYVQVMASKYLYLRCVVRPRNKILHLFVKRGGFSSVASRVNPNFYTSTLPLGVKAKIEPFGEVEKVVLKHHHPFEERVIPTYGKCNYKGNIVDHRGTATLIVYDYAEASSDTEYAEPVPSYFLKDAPGDFEIGPMASVGLGNPVDLPTQPSNVREYIKKLLLLVKSQARQIEVLTQESTEQTRRSSFWHQKEIQTGGALKSTKEELSGLLRNAPDFMKSIARYVMDHYRAEEDLHALMKPLSRWQSLLQPWLLIPIMGALILGFLATQPQVLEGASNFFGDPSNQIWIAIIALIGVGGGYYFLKLLRKRKG